ILSTGNRCSASRAVNCSVCLQAGPNCAYCPDEVSLLAYSLSSHRLMLPIPSPPSLFLTQNVQIDTNRNYAQVAPQQMTMTLLPGEERELVMEVFEPGRGPLDLYILMDFSNSMSDDLDNLKRMGDQLAKLVGTLSDDYTIGFGKFVDKVIEPQTDMRPSKLAQPWPNSDPPFSFRHVIPLTNNINTFRQILQKERISGNLDAPEGGFDAILQAAVCQSQIGWRNDTTHLLVFSTESAFHYEADGVNVLAGVLDRNDEKCHLDTGGSYTHATLQDYPSVPTLVRTLMKHNIIPIFAITNHSLSYYERLLEYFPIAELGVLTDDSSNILHIIENAFKVCVILLVIANVTVRLSARTEYNDKHVCSLSPNDRSGLLRVKPTTFSSALRIQTNVLCATCECEKNPIERAARCNGNGALVCGVCRCYNKWMGPFCNCSAQFQSDAECNSPGMTEPCSGRGDCVCGTCICHNPSQYDGPFCQYDKSQCQRYGGFLCNDRGGCLLGKCVCDDEWTGNSCECPLSNMTCRDNKGGLCNGRGVCKCGRCECEHTGLALGSTCEPNFQAQLGMCESRRSCVQCQAWKTGERKGDKCKDCPFKVVMVDELKENCPPGGFLWLIPLIMFLMLLLGLLLLCCWKYCACCKVRRMVGFKEDHYMLRQSLLTSDHLDTPMVRTGPPKSTDVVRWKVKDNVHRPANHPQNQIQPNPKEMSESGITKGLNNKRIPGAQTVQKTRFRQNNTIVDTVLPAPRGSYNDIVNLTDKQVQSGNFSNLRVMPGYYTVATDRDATGAVELQEGVESVDVRVPLFIKDEDDAKKELLVEAIDVPLGIAKIGKRFVNITVIKENAKSIFTFLQPSYTFSRQDAVANIPISREIIEDGRTQVTYSSRDLTAKDKKDYVSVDGDMAYGPGETQKLVQVKLLQLAETDSLLDKQLKQFVLDLSNPRQGAKLGRIPRTTINITDMSFQQSAPSGRLHCPANIEATPIGPKNIRLNWKPQMGAKGYKVKYWIYGDPEAEAQVVDVKNTQAELTNLYPYCDYEMRVCAYNSQGDGEYSDIVQCQTLEDVPSEPGRLAFNVIGPTVTQLSWAEPAEPNGVITEYEVVYTPINENNKPTGPSKKVKIDNPKKRMLLIENLQPSQTYFYKVRASNKVGWGPYRDATINLASQPHRPMSIPIIPDIPIVDAEAGEEYDSFLMYSNEVLRSPTTGTRPSVSDMSEGKRWKHVKLVGSDLDLRMVSWKLPADVIPHRLSSSTEASDDLPPASHLRTPHPGGQIQTSQQGEDPKQNQMINGKWDQKFMFPGGSSSLTRNISTSSTNYSVSPRPGGGNQSMETMTTYVSGKGLWTFRPSKELVDVRASVLLMSVLSTCCLFPADSRLPRGVPETPSRLVFSALGPTALKVSWQEPHCDTPVLGYRVLYQLLSGGEMKQMDVANPAQNSVVVQDLLPNQSYLFKVKAQSQEGWGPEREGVITIESTVDPKSPLSPVPGSSFTLSTPSAPGPLVFTALSPETLQLSWDKPRKPNGEILGYVVTCEQLHGGGDLRSFQVSGNAATSLTVSDLKENVPYKFKVQAQTTQGFGPEREGIITIESQDGGTDLSHALSLSQTHKLRISLFDMVTQHMEVGGSVMRQMEMVQRGVTSTVTKRVEKQYYEA
uniref:Integrin beta n=1 Tax=Astyanax mexicanus TaxID=7994 RepID=A0A8B9LL02_ASTMX